MSVWKPVTGRSPHGYAISAALTFWSVLQAQAQQTNIDNIQSAIQPYVNSIFTGAAILESNFGPASPGPGDVKRLTADKIQEKLNADNLGACLDDSYLAVVLFYYNERDEKHPKNKYLHDALGNISTTYQPDATFLGKYFSDNHDAAPKIISGFFNSERDEGVKGRRFAKAAIQYFLTLKFSKSIAPAPTNFCDPKVTLKASAPFNPSDETNVLKSSQNNSPGTSWGYGGNLQAFVPVTLERNQKNSFDILGFSAQSQSVRYGQYSTKSFDSITTQAAYQLFMDASGYQSDGLGTLRHIDRISPADPSTPPKDIPPTGMITVDSLAFGFQNQTVYTAAFSKESANLFTPQITFNRQNQDLPVFGASGNVCKAAIPDPRKDGFCLYADFAVTLGETLSDVATQKNANVAFSATPGMRIPLTDWKLTLPMTATEREYQEVVGGRRDTLLQIGPALTYSPPPFNDRYGGSYAVTFALPLTYNQNYSTVQADGWHGVVVLPTLTVAFAPPPPTPPSPR